jgi:hypothetical protein
VLSPKGEENLQHLLSFFDKKRLQFAFLRTNQINSMTRKWIVIMIPVFNDCPSLSLAVKQLAHIFSDRISDILLLIVDDGSVPALRISYRLYRLLFLILTGHRIRFGNLSAMPMGVARRLADMSELWLSLPAIPNVLWTKHAHRKFVSAGPVPGLPVLARHRIWA